MAAYLDFSQGKINSLPQTGSQTFEQIGATRFSFPYGTPSTLGTISNARLVLSPANPISAVLKMTMTRGGSTDNVAIPLRAGMGTGLASDQTDPEKMFALRAAKIAGSQETSSELQGGDDYT